MARNQKIFFYFFTILIIGCTGLDSFDDADNINYDAEFAIPLFTSKISVSDLVENASENTTMRVEPDGSVTILFNGDLITQGADEILPVVPGLGDVQLFDTVAQIPFIFDDVILREALIKGDVIHFRFRNDIPEDITVRMWIPQLTKDGEVFEQNFVIPYAGELPVGLTTEDVSLEGWELVSNDNTITYFYDARRPNGERIVLDKAWANVNFLFFTFMEGYFGKSPFDIAGDIITIGIFDKWVAGTLEFDDPKVVVRVDNSFGFPVRSQANTLSITTLSGEVLDIEADVIDEGIDFAYPSLDEIGEVKSTTFNFDKDNSNIREIFNEKAAKLTYDIDALANPDDDSSVPNFATDSSFFLINMAVELPLKGKANNFTIIDTAVTDLDIAEEFTEAEFKLITQNHFPVDMLLQIEFYDDNGVLVDEMFDPPLLLEAGDLLPDNTTNPLPELTSFVNYDNERLDKVKGASSILLRGVMNSVGVSSESIIILNSSIVDVRMGVKLRLTE